ncbi:2-oxo acid dehydrogenase subunit E2 [Intrasporangium sp. YIM S08009]|uniref:2-oxo acid dehydrogenase subunit E2 n=1 Tax=Intrasporangium zincisolvens TaxID=3080018 RepID=UPI002B05B382|nr:2-oxo acid dehydrogenase subunit E2 [Intrasporangium sp. YIM S08009]
MSGPSGFVVRGIPPERQPVLDRLAGAARRFQVHALVELDVGEAQRRIDAATEHVSWTGFVTASVAAAVALHPEVNARKAGRRVLYFDRVDVGATVEREGEGRPTLDIVVLRDADRLSCAEVTAALHRAKVGPAQPHPPGPLLGPVLRLPGPLRRAAVRAAATLPAVSASFGPAVGVTSIGMFSSTWGWAVPLAPLTVIVTVGGVAERPVVRDGQVVVRPMLPLTISLDHAVVDGAPAARFVETLRRLVETAAAFDPARQTGDAASAR